MARKTTHPLDALLPLLEPDGERVGADAVTLEVADLAQLVEIAADPKLARFLLARLSDTVALVDPGSEDDLVKALRAAGHTPRVARGVAP